MRIASLDKLPEGTTSHNKAGKKKVFVGNNAVPHITQYAHVSLSPGEVIEEHSHADMYEIMYVAKGAGVFKIEGASYNVKQGDCVTVAPYEKHEVKVLGDSEMVLFVTGVAV